MKTTAENRRAPIFSGCLHTRYLLAQFQFPRISYSLKASAEERAPRKTGLSAMYVACAQTIYIYIYIYI